MKEKGRLWYPGTGGRREMPLSLRTYRVPVPAQLYAVCEELNRTAGRIYSKTLSVVKKVKERKGFWLSESAAQRWILRWAEDIQIHTHSKQAFVQLYFQALRSYLKNARKTKEAKPPYRRKKYLPFIWKNTAIKYRSGCIMLSLGKSRQALKVPALFPEGTVFRQAKLVHENGRYYLHLATEVEIALPRRQGQIAGVDLGVIRPLACVFQDGACMVYHGGELSSLIRYRNKRLSSFQSAIQKARKGSRRYKKLVRAKRRFLKRIRNQIRDLLHKLTSHFIRTCVERGVSKILIGDLSHIRDRAKYSRKANQKIHQWAFRKIEQMIQYKAEAVGIEVLRVSERYTSKRCPVCGRMNEVRSRSYRCSSCGFIHHRDVVGAVNILSRYLKSIGATGTVVAALAPATGVRYHPHLRGQGGLAPWKQTSSLQESHTL